MVKKQNENNKYWARFHYSIRSAINAQQVLEVTAPGTKVDRAKNWRQFVPPKTSTNPTTCTNQCVENAATIQVMNDSTEEVLMIDENMDTNVRDGKNIKFGDEHYKEMIKVLLLPENKNNTLKYMSSKIKLIPIFHDIKIHVIYKHLCGLKSKPEKFCKRFCTISELRRIQREKRKH